MESYEAIWLASIFGPLLAIVGMWMVVLNENFLKVIASMKATPGAFYLAGIINLLIGITVISMYSEWVWDSSLLVTLVGWVFLVRGVLSLFMPHMLIKWTMTDHTTIKLTGVFPFIWGLALCWFAFLR